MTGDADTRPTVLTADSHRSYRWRNGLGTAMEIATAGIAPERPDAGPDWTLSVATVDADVAFSVFPGRDRWLMALSDGGLGLLIDDVAHHLPCRDVVAFAGESATSATGVIEPTLDLNLMVARDRFSGSLDTVLLERSGSVASPPGITTFVVLLAGVATLDDGTPLAPLDAVRLAPDSRITVDGACVLAVARIIPVA